jgi:hypothetical protein
MAVAAVTPRVRTIVVCDDVSLSPTENGVFNLEGVRQHLEAASFPLRAELNLYLVLSSARKGGYAGTVLVINERDDRVIRVLEFAALFANDNALLPLYLELGGCLFPEPGSYRFEIYFSARDREVLKGEHPFNVLAVEE